MLLSHVPIISLILSQAIPLPSHFERQCGASCRQGRQLYSAFALAMRHAPRPVWAVAWYTTCNMSNLHYVICVDMPRSPLVPCNSRGSSLLCTMGYNSLHTLSYREPKLCEFGREIRIRSEPHGMAKA